MFITLFRLLWKWIFHCTFVYTFSVYFSIYFFSVARLRHCNSWHSCFVRAFFVYLTLRQYCTIPLPLWYFYCVFIITYNKWKHSYVKFFTAEQKGRYVKKNYPVFLILNFFQYGLWQQSQFVYLGCVQLQW